MILVMGLSKTGNSICEYLTKKQVPFAVYDGDSEKVKDYQNRGIKSFAGDEIIDLKNIDLAVKSPGFPPHEALSLIHI